MISYNETFDADGRLIDRVEDRGDGTGTHTVYHPDGSTTVTDVELPVRAIDTGTDLDTVAALVAAQQATIDALLDALAGNTP